MVAKAFNSPRRKGILLAGAALCLSGCVAIGPKSISAGRGIYAEVINQTEDEQILNALVRQRYDETFGMLSVASITASLRFSTSAAANVGIGSEDNYSGNLVPLAAGVGYEENPTISYVPLSGDEFMLRMFSPVSPAEWHLIGQNAGSPGEVLAVVAESINGLRNPLLGEEIYSPDFDRFLQLYDELIRNGVLDVTLVRDFTDDDSTDRYEYTWTIHDYKAASIAQVREFLGLLDIDANTDGEPIRLPLYRIGDKSGSGVRIQDHSAYEIIRLFANGIEVPEPHLAAGIVERRAELDSKQRRIINIRSSKQAPANYTARVLFRDWWFYIDATDTESKQAFRFLRALIGIRLAGPEGSQGAPTLTLPVN